MKRLSVLLIVFLLVFSLGLCACGSSATVPEPSPDGGRSRRNTDDPPISKGDRHDDDSLPDDSSASSGRDSDMIPLTSLRASKAVLMETFNHWFEDNIRATYEEFVEHIGCDASAYSPGDMLTYVWYAADDDEARLYVNYLRNDAGEWECYSLMAYGLAE